MFFFSTVSLKKKKVIKTTSKSVSFFFWCVLIVGIATVVVIESVSVAVCFHRSAFFNVWSSCCQLLLVMCPCRMVLVKGLNPAENSAGTQHSVCLTA